MSLVFIKAPNFPFSHLITPPPILGSQHTCTQYEPLALPTTSHMHGVCRTCSCVPKWPSASSQLCVMCPTTGITHELPLLHPQRSLSFNLTTGFPEHFTFPSVVQQMCLNGTKHKKKRGGAGNASSHWKEVASYLFSSVCFLFSSC